MSNNLTIHAVKSGAGQSPSSPPVHRNGRLQLRQRHKVLLSRVVIPFAWPIFVELGCVVLMGIVSTILVSHLGKSETAAAGVSDSVTFIIISLLTAIALGGSVFIAQAFGRRNREKSRAGAGQVMNLCVLISLVACLGIQIYARPLLEVVAFGAEKEVIDLAQTYLRLIAFSYPALSITLAGAGILRGMGNSRLPAMCNILMNILNIIYSYPLIYGLSGLGIGQWQGMGIAGAGLGVLAARWSGAVIIILVLMHNNTLSIPFRTYFKPFQRNVLGDILGIGIPASVESLMFNVGKLITQIMVAGMGTVAMAGNVISFSAVLMINIPGNALAMTATVLIGRRLGQNKPKSAYQEMVLVFWCATILLSLFAAISVPLAPLVARCYTDEQDVIDVVVRLMWLNAVMMPVWAASFVLPSAFKGAKDVKYSMWIAIASMWGCRIVCGYLLGIALNMGVYGVWLGMFFDWWIRGGLFFARMLNRRWLGYYFHHNVPQGS